MLHAFVSAAEVDAPVPRDATRPVSDLMKRMSIIPPSRAQLRQNYCVASRCYCNRGFCPFCGNEGINPYCINSHVYQCFEDGSTCEYGSRQSCPQCGSVRCPGYE